MLDRHAPPHPCAALTTEPTPPSHPDTIDRRRRRLVAALPGLGLAMSGGVLSGCATAPADPRAVPARDAVVPFSPQSAMGEPPAGWSPYIIRKDLAKTDYAIQALDGRAVLHATSNKARSGLHCPVSIDPQATPWLRWQWRVDELHEGATVDDDDLEDTPARVVVAFDGDISRLPLRDRMFYEQVELFTGLHLPFATLTYVWDGQLKVGRVVPYARTRRIQYQVVESGRANVGRWLSYERNVVEDFISVFGQKPPGRITSVGVMTDSDDLKNRVEAWYGDIGLFAGPQRSA